MTDQEIKELGKEEMKNQYGYNANKPYYDNGFLLGYKKAQAEQLILSGVTQRSELLLAYTKWEHEFELKSYNKNVRAKMVDEFISQL